MRLWSSTSVSLSGYATSGGVSGASTQDKCRLFSCISGFIMNLSQNIRNSWHRPPHYTCLTTNAADMTTEGGPKNAPLALDLCFAVRLCNQRRSERRINTRQMQANCMQYGEGPNIIVCNSMRKMVTRWCPSSFISRAGKWGL